MAVKTNSPEVLWPRRNWEGPGGGGKGVGQAGPPGEAAGSRAHLPRQRLPVHSTRLLAVPFAPACLQSPGRGTLAPPPATHTAPPRPAPPGGLLVPMDDGVEEAAVAPAGGEVVAAQALVALHHALGPQQQLLPGAQGPPGPSSNLPEGSHQSASQTTLLCLGSSVKASCSLVPA